MGAPKLEERQHHNVAAPQNYPALQGSTIQKENSIDE